MPKPTEETFHEYLENKSQPHILHFDGHGVFARKCEKCSIPTFNQAYLNKCDSCQSLLPRPGGYLAFETQNHYKHYLRSRTLVQYSSSLHLVVLSTCDSGTVRGESLFNGLGPAFILGGVPAVVAMQLPVLGGLESATQNFMEAFYRELASSRSISEAVSSGRRRLSETNEWFIPVFYLRRQDNKHDI